MEHRSHVIVEYMIQYVLAIGYLNIACVTLSRQAQLKGSITLGMGYFSEDSQVEMFSHLSFTEENTFRHSCVENSRLCHDQSVKLQLLRREQNSVE